MHAYLSKCLLLLKMQYTLSEDFFFNLPLTTINSLTINTITLYHYAYISVYLAFCQPINISGE
jgi:fucose 4-O-acetylase-like acetyltransferase